MKTSDRKLTIIHWICTGFVALLMGVGSISNILSWADSVALFQQLGYPVYLLPFLGVAKLMGVCDTRTRVSQNQGMGICRSYL